MLKSIGEDIWMVEGRPVSFFGFPYPTRMVVVRFLGDKLWIWSPIALSKELIAEVNNLGKVAYIVSPNKIHHLFMGEWKKQWPDATLVASPGLPERMKDLGFDVTLDGGVMYTWSEEISHVIIRGSLALEEVWFFHKKSKTLMVCDMIQRFDPKKAKGIKGWVMRLDGLVGDKGSTPREWRLSFIDRKKAREAVRTALSWAPRQLIIAHGACVFDGATTVVRDALRWLGV